MKIRITNCDGEVVMLKELSSSLSNLKKDETLRSKVENLSKGIYFINYHFRNSSFTNRVILK